MLFQRRNEIKQYAIVDEKNKVVIYFRLRMAAKKWISEHQVDYFDNKLRIIKNDKV